MPEYVRIYNSSIEGESIESEISRVPELLKAYPDGTSRSVFFRNDQNSGLYGPFVMVFSIRRASDILLENCIYQGMEIQIEVSGKKLPQLPSYTELSRILQSENVLIHINGSVFKPSGEVFGFQQVYDDSVKCIDTLKRMGLAQETFSIYATPEDITIEVHPGPLGLEGRPDMADLYFRLLCHTAEIREQNGRPAKTSIKTVLLQSCSEKFRVLLPGSTHPVLHRPRVNVGASHFAYGIAAFSDYCGRKRSLQECLQETFNWVKFVQSDLPAVPGIVEKLAQLPAVSSAPEKGSLQKNVAAAVGGDFQPLRKKIEDFSASIVEVPSAIKCFAPVLGKALGGGWNTGGLHFITGPRESGKAVFMMQQALNCGLSGPVLYVSLEHSLREFVLRCSASSGAFNLGDAVNLLHSGGDSAVEAKKFIMAGIGKAVSRFGDKFYFSGSEANRERFDGGEILQLADMIPQTSSGMIFIESVEFDELEDLSVLTNLRNAASARGLTIWLSVHVPAWDLKRPHFIEGEDHVILKRFQRFADSIITINSEKTNLRKFVAMVKGQIDAQLVGSLEQKALQLAGGKRYKSDTSSFARVIHTRSGRRELVLMMLQPDSGRFFELASLPLQRS